MWSRFTLRPALALTAFVLLTRLPALLHPKAIDDEQVYSVVAIEMLHGGQPYVDAVERKPPFLFEVYRGVFAVAGPYNWVALHLVSVLWTLATMATLYLIARRLFDPATGAWAALLYGLFLAWADYRCLAFNGELLMNLPAAMATAIVFGGARGRWRPGLLLAGGLVATGFLLKQPSGIVGLPLGIYLLLPSYRARRGLSVPVSLLQATLFTLGFLAALGAVGFWLWRGGILGDAVYWSVTSQGGAFGPFTWAYWDRALSNTAFFAVATLPLLIGAVLSLREGHQADGLWTGHRAEFVALVVLLAASLVGVGVNGQFLFHYYLQLVLPLALLAAPVFSAAWRDAAPRFGPLGHRRLVAGWLALSSVTFLAVDTIGLWRNREPLAAGRYVREHSQPEDRIFMWGQGDRLTGIYLDAERRPASRYIASFPLTGHVFGAPVDPAFDTSNRVAPRAWEHLRADFNRHPPRYIIDTDAVRERPDYPISRYPFLRNYLQMHYGEVARFPDGVVYERLPDPN